MIHPSLPKSITPEVLGQWLVQNSKERFTEERKYYYSEEEIHEFKDTAVKSGIELNKLSRLKKKALKLIEGGTPDHKVIDFPETAGSKVLKAVRQDCEQEVESGYKTELITIYGIPNQETCTMDFFDIQGNEITERCRPLSAKEIREYLGLFANNQQKQA